MSDPTPEERAKNEAGVLLPGVAPEIGEMVLATLYGNPDASLSTVVVALCEAAPAPAVAVDLVNALIELTLCKTIGDLLWVEESGTSVLTGLRRVSGRSGIIIGDNSWPLTALLTSEPQAITLETSQGRKRMWLASGSLEDAVFLQSEAVALGNAVVETFGGRVVEDRMGPDVLDKSQRELKLSKAGRARAEALNQAATAPAPGEAPEGSDLRLGHNRVAIAEAVPGTLAKGLAIHPEGNPAAVYEIDGRVNDSWVIAVSIGEGPLYNTEAAAWVRADGKPPVDIENAPLHAGFSDEPAIAR